jgi:hypothetical protein
MTLSMIKEGFSIVHLRRSSARLHAASLQLLTTCPLRTWSHGDNKHSQGRDLKFVVRSGAGSALGRGMP